MSRRRNRFDRGNTKENGKPGTENQEPREKPLPTVHEPIVTFIPGAAIGGSVHVNPHEIFVRIWPSQEHSNTTLNGMTNIQYFTFLLLPLI